jgi:hypothetical protein
VVGGIAWLWAPYMKTGKRQEEKISDLKYRRALIPGFMIRGDF